jgi:ubiquinone biosynthesis protein
MALTRFSQGRRQPAVNRILAATDRSDTADRAVEWAAEMAKRYGGELLLLQVLADGNDDAYRNAVSGLAKLSERLAAPHTRLQVVVDSDPSRAIVEAAEQDGTDVLVVGGMGMSGRKEFLLGNVPNRVSHNARCTVVIVNTGVTPPRRLFKR